MSKNQFTGTATQPQCKRIFCQFNNDQNCILPVYIHLNSVFIHLQITTISIKLFVEEMVAQVYILKLYFIRLAIYDMD